MKRILFFLITCLMGNYAQAQKSTITLGANTASFGDWKYKYWQFNPELGYSRQLSAKYDLFANLSVLGYTGGKVPVEVGTSIQRVLFTVDAGLQYRLNRFRLGAGISGRYILQRTVVYIYSPTEPHYGTEGISQPQVGLNFHAQYKIPIAARHFLLCKAGYKLFAHGPNPLAFGVAYGFRL